MGYVGPVEIYTLTKIPDAMGIPGEDEEAKKDHNTVNPSDMHDAMKRYPQLKTLLVRLRNQNSPFCF